MLKRRDKSRLDKFFQSSFKKITSNTDPNTPLSFFQNTPLSF
jgi:hypothetical protein